MRLRTQFAMLVTLAVAVGVGALSTLVWSVREARTAAHEQELAVTVAREVTGLLVLTQDYLLHGEPRAQQQWLARYRIMSEAIATQATARSGAEREGVPGEEIEALSVLFAELTSLPEPGRDTPLLARQRELLVDSLLTEAQTISEHAYTREREFTRRRNAAETRLMTLAVLLPAVLALLFALGGWLLARRVLRPLAQLSSSMDAVASGQLSGRTGSTARDELGELSRRFDSMTAQLEERSASLRSSEAMLRLVTDNLPAMIGYWDSELRNRFANADYVRWFGKTPQEIHGRTIGELLGPELYEKNRPFINAALAGKRQDFSRSIPGPDGVLRHSQASYIPDVHLGRVDGFFVLVTDVTDRVKAEQALAQSLAEKETLLKEVYHRIKNNLQVVQSLLNIQSRSVQDANARTALQDMAQRVRSMALVHEQLYRAPDLSAIPLKKYVEDLVRQIATGSARALDEIRVEVQAPPQLDLGMDAAIPLGLLLTELLSNSFKHGFPEGRQGRIVVRFDPEPDGVRVCVSDDGVGLPPGFDPETAHSMGLQLASSLATQLGGRLHFESGPGTTVWLVASRL
ncbi:MAG: hypothetical protein Tsb007_25660 [Rhizobacter sp.]